MTVCSFVFQLPNTVSADHYHFLCSWWLRIFICSRSCETLMRPPELFRRCSIINMSKWDKTNLLRLAQPRKTYITKSWTSVCVSPPPPFFFAVTLSLSTLMFCVPVFTLETNQETIAKKSPTPLWIYKYFNAIATFHHFLFFYLRHELNLCLRSLSYRTISLPLWGAGVNLS